MLCNMRKLILVFVNVLIIKYSSVHNCKVNNIKLPILDLDLDNRSYSISGTSR